MRTLLLRARFGRGRALVPKKKNKKKGMESRDINHAVDGERLKTQRR